MESDYEKYARIRREEENAENLRIAAENSKKQLELNEKYLKDQDQTLRKHLDEEARQAAAARAAQEKLNEENYSEQRQHEADLRDIEEKKLEAIKLEAETKRKEADSRLRQEEQRERLAKKKTETQALNDLMEEILAYIQRTEVQANVKNLLLRLFDLPNTETTKTNILNDYEKVILTQWTQEKGFTSAKNLFLIPIDEKYLTEINVLRSITMNYPFVAEAFNQVLEMGETTKPWHKSTSEKQNALISVILEGQTHIPYSPYIAQFTKKQPIISHEIQETPEWNQLTRSRASLTTTLSKLFPQEIQLLNDNRARIAQSWNQAILRVASRSSESNLRGKKSQLNRAACSKELSAGLLELADAYNSIVGEIKKDRLPDSTYRFFDWKTYQELVSLAIKKIDPKITETVSSQVWKSQHLGFNTWEKHLPRITLLESTINEILEAAYGAESSEGKVLRKDRSLATGDTLLHFLNIFVTDHYFNTYEKLTGSPPSVPPGRNLKNFGPMINAGPELSESIQQLFLQPKPLKWETFEDLDRFMDVLSSVCEQKHLRIMVERISAITLRAKEAAQTIEKEFQNLKTGAQFAAAKYDKENGPQELTPTLLISLDELLIDIALQRKYNLLHEEIPSGSGLFSRIMRGIP